MRGQATIAPGGRYLRFEFEHDATVEDWRKAQALLMQLMQETGIRRVLVLADPARADYQFIETVALNRGKRVRLFPSNEETAGIQWLEAGAEPGPP